MQRRRDYGGRSGGLVDADLDCPEALDLAPEILPPTAAIFGRPSKPKSHWLYSVEGVAQSLTFKDPITGAMLVELRGDGGRQTLFPPSRHPSGERVKTASSIFGPLRKATFGGHG
jgi:hypothetical protein